MGTTQRCNLADDKILGRAAKGELTDDSGDDRHARLLFVLRLPECLLSSETVMSAAPLRLRPPPSSRHALKPMTSTTSPSSTMRSIAPEFGPQVATTLLVCAALLSPGCCPLGGVAADGSIRGSPLAVTAAQPRRLRAIPHLRRSSSGDGCTEKAGLDLSWR
jgi:hypothetical protein